jgi:hypothetical protein
MNVQTQAAMLVQAMALGNVHAALDQAQAAPVPASAPASDHAAVILELSCAAQSLVGAGG